MLVWVVYMKETDLKLVAEGRLKRLTALSKLNIVAELFDDRAIVWDPKLGYELFIAGFFGKPVGISKPKLAPFDEPLELSMYETLYLVEKNVLKVRKIKHGKEKYLTTKELMKICKSTYRDFEAKYTVYKDLRERGYVVRPGLKFGSDFSVYRYGPGIDHAPFLVTVYSANTKLLGIDFVRAGRLANSVRKKWVIATLLPDKTIRYFVFSWYRL